MILMDTTVRFFFYFMILVWQMTTDDKWQTEIYIHIYRLFLGKARLPEWCGGSVFAVGLEA